MRRFSPNLTGRFPQAWDEIRSSAFGEKIVTIDGSFLVVYFDKVAHSARECESARCIIRLKRGSEKIVRSIKDVLEDEYVSRVTKDGLPSDRGDCYNRHRNVKRPETRHFSSL